MQRNLWEIFNNSCFSKLIKNLDADWKRIEKY